MAFELTRITMEKTIAQYDRITAHCKDLFLKKSADYGTSWRVLRPVSIVDQIFIKAQRIRTIQQLGTQKVQDQVDQEFMGIVNYGIIALMQQELPADDQWELPVSSVRETYERILAATRHLMQEKNHDYGEAWRQMSLESLTDLILMKLQRIRRILHNEGKTEVSEGMDANFRDIINYAVFALIQLEETPHTIRS